MAPLDGEKANLTKLKAAYGRNTATRALLDHFAGRKNAMRETSVDRLLTILRGEGTEVSRGGIIQAMKDLEEAGCGEFRVGRRGARSRFEWKVDLVSVGQAAAGERKDIEAISEEAVEVESEEQSLAHTFQLRPGRQVKLDLPGDLTTREAARLADFIRTLPFESREA